MAKKPLEKRLYWNIYLHQKMSCFYCKMPCDYFLMEKEHIFPRSKGGHGIKNKVLSCSHCNKLKSHLLISEFKEVVEKRLEVICMRELKERYKNVIETCNKLLSGELAREGWHEKAFYYTENQCEKPRLNPNTTK
jgi:hypothetical protein